MKRLLVACCIILAVGFLSCVRYRGNNVSIEMQETDNTFTFHGLYNKKKTRKVQQYMDDQIGNNNNLSFVNTTMDATITLDDRTTMYVKLKQGELGIKMDRSKNSYASYVRVREMCEGLKQVMSENGTD
ncbi:MAG: hypothetical protein J0I41_17680 [Filimonas sp.]|nr:hypothetical protein [Filimonas sp.]